VTARTSMVPITRVYHGRAEPTPEPSRTAVFLDRDGVINVNRAEHVRSWSEFDFLPSACRAIRVLAALDLAIVVVTNQANVGRGLITEETLASIHDQMVEAIEAEGGRVDAVVACPHRPEDGCGCRKPEPGMLLWAAHALNLDLPHSYFIGDHESDVEAARRAGCQPILVLSGRQMQSAGDASNLSICKDLHQAVRVVGRAIQSIVAAPS
jgi:D-glycero-D-manno-heptose 1,7-bisphosphate phosphatase